jgi:hypothetical protein
MPFINRSAVVVHYKQPYVDWANRLPDRSPEEPVYTLANFKENGGIFLIPPFEVPEEMERYIQEMKSGIFDFELTTWSEDEDLWPKKRDTAAFDEWFELEIRDEVMDTVEEPIEKEEE